jgi:hypothetical protein
VTIFFKLFHNKVDCSSLLSGLCISVPQILSRYFYVPRANTNVLNHSSSFRMCSMFNCFNDICDLHAMPLPSILVVILCNLDRLFFYRHSVLFLQQFSCRVPNCFHTVFNITDGVVSETAVIIVVDCC